MKGFDFNIKKIILFAVRISNGKTWAEEDRLVGRLSPQSRQEMLMPYTMVIALQVVVRSWVYFKDRFP